MRADRLVAAVLHLQRHGRTTAAELATVLEVSVATARRDLEALGAAGIPVYPQPGRGGGWQLVGGARTDLTGLTRGEVQALFLALGPAIGSSGDAATTLAKLVRALPAPFRDEAELALGSTVRDPVAWGGRPADPEDPRVAVLRGAVLASRRVRLRHRGRDGGTSDRVVDPWGLVDKAGTSYLVAGTPRGPRTFRLDRVVDLEVTEETFVRPDDVDVAAVWRDGVEHAERARSAVRARVRVDPAVLGPLRQVLGAAVEPGARPGEHVVTGHTVRGLAEQLAGWGARVQVLEPPELRAELRALAAELLQAHAEP